MSLKRRTEELFKEYGPVFLGTYLVIFCIVFAGFFCAIRLGVNVEGAKAAAGTLAASYLATKLTTPFRVAAAAALTPIVGRRFGKKA